MKIALSTSKGGLEDEVYPLFGRCLTFTIVNTSEKEGNANIVPNPGTGAGGGAGIAAAQAIIEAGADTVITGNCGPNALAVLLASEIKVYISSGKVKDAIKKLIGGKLVPIDRPTVPLNSGAASGVLGKKRGGRV